MRPTTAIDEGTEERIWKALKKIQDPEIPVLSLVDLNVIRGVRLEQGHVVVTMTPTFAGCPAMEQMKSDVIDSLRSLGFEQTRIEVVLAPSWSTDTLSEEAKERLRVFGIAAPPARTGSLEATLQLPVPCPFCKSVSTTLESPFGATLCKQIFYCNDCRQSFERFKPL